MHFHAFDTDGNNLTRAGEVTPASAKVERSKKSDWFSVATRQYDPIRCVHPAGVTIAYLELRADAANSPKMRALPFLRITLPEPARLKPGYCLHIAPTIWKVESVEAAKARVE